MEIPWWTYGARGMQLWFPSSLAEPVSPSTEQMSRPVDPELEFDREVYPIGISLAEVAIIGELSAVHEAGQLCGRRRATLVHSPPPAGGSVCH